MTFEDASRRVIAAVDAGMAALAAARQAEVDLQALAQQPTDPVPAPPPAPTPPPPPPPPDPPAPPPAPVGQVFPTIHALDSKRLLVWGPWFTAGEAYDREEHALSTDGAPLTLRLYGASMGSSPFGTRPLLSSVYTATAVSRTGQVLLSIDYPAAGTNYIDIVLPVDSLPHCRVLLYAAGDAGETCVPIELVVDRGQGPFDYMAVVSATYAVKDRQWSSYGMAWVPAQDKPITQPMPPREWLPFSQAEVPAPTKANPNAMRFIGRRDLVERQIVPADHAEAYIPRLSRVKPGAPPFMHTNSQQSYYLSQMTANNAPGIVVRGGPRGQARLSMLTHITPGRTANIVLTPWGRASINRATGFVRPLSGYWHDGTPERIHNATDAQLAAACRLYGTWEGVKGYAEAWGGGTLDYTVQVDESSPLVPNNGTMEHTHAIAPNSPYKGPTYLVADSKNNRVCAETYAPDSHGPEPYIRDLYHGPDIWDILPIPGTRLAVASVRKAHKLVVINTDTGAEVEVLAETKNGDDYAMLNSSRVPKRRRPLEEVRAQDCILPEGLFWHDNRVCWASSAMAQVRAIHWHTREKTVLLEDGPVSDGINFYKLAMSRGGFGPSGTMFLSTWSISPRGRPRAFLPDQRPWPYMSLDASIYGPGLPTPGIDYSSCCAIDDERGILLHSASTPGLWEVTLARPGDKVITEAEWKAWEGEYHERALELTHGQGGWGKYGLPQCWGVSPNIDNYLRAHGHVQGA